jgi:hypothetical protein
VSYYTRVLTKNEDVPTIEELTSFLQTDFPDFKLSVEEGDEEEWERLLLSTDDDLEVALIERNPVYDGSVAQDDIADLREDLVDVQPEANVEWLEDYLDEVTTVYAFQHLQGADTDIGGNALHAIRHAFWERGESILQADGEGFTNEEGFHITWQYNDDITGVWNMAVMQDGTWHQFKMDLGDPDHREAFCNGEVPEDITEILG